MNCNEIFNVGIFYATDAYKRVCKFNEELHADIEKYRAENASERRDRGRPHVPPVREERAVSEYIIDGSDRRSTKAARNASIYEEREAGAKFIEIADKYGLTVERVRQIWRKEQWHRSRFDGLQPIVRCRDCRFFDGSKYYGCDLLDISVPDMQDGFCAWGERRDA